jgi:1-acyl-sn-glycerol-3-phosphate acyltransferase
VHPLLRALTQPLDRDDPASVDPELVDWLSGPLARFGERWYRLKVHGMERIPERPVLIVGNHNAGTAFVEALAAGAMVTRAGHNRLTGLAHDAVIDAPLVGRVLARTGAVRAGHDSAAKAFAAGRQVIVFPGGNREAFRPWRDRHHVQLGDRRGFIRLALRHGVDILPWAFHGGHSSFFVLRDGQRLAKAIGANRWLRSDTWPLYVGLPWGVALGPWPHLPLPVRASCQFMPVVHVPKEPEAANDPAVIEALYDRVVQQLQAGVDELRAKRP